MRTVMRVALDAAGHDVAAAEHGPAALALVATGPPDVILLDSRMPVMDGVRFEREHRRVTADPAPIVAASARCDAALYAWLVGAAEVLPTVFGVEDHVTALERAARGRLL